MNNVTTDVLVMVIVASYGLGFMSHVIYNAWKHERNKSREIARRKQQKESVDFIKQHGTGADWEDNSE